MGLMLSRYIQEAMKRARYKTLEDGTYFGQMQEVLEEWLILKIRDHDSIPRIGRVGLTVKAA